MAKSLARQVDPAVAEGVDAGQRGRMSACAWARLAGLVKCPWWDEAGATGGLAPVLKGEPLGVGEGPSFVEVGEKGSLGEDFLERNYQGACSGDAADAEFLHP